MLPAGKEFWSHPFKFIATYGHVYKLHTDYITAETAERRKKNVDDVQKRSRYRKAHGLEDEQGLGGWTVRSDVEPESSATHDQGPSNQVNAPPNEAASPIAIEAEPSATPRAAGSDQSGYVDFEGRRRPVKRWLGIWE